MKKFFLIGIVALSFSAVAGDKGNGGDAVVCEDGRVFLLDSYEATKRNMKVDIPGNTLREKVSKLTERLIAFDEYNGEAVKKLALKMVTDLEIGEENPSAMALITMTNDPLVDIDDSHETSIPLRCKKEQLIINKTIVYARDMKFEMRKDLWEKFDLDNKAMTIAHESIYNWLILAGAEDSRFARYLNGYFAQNDIELDFSIYITDILNSGLKINLQLNGDHVNENYIFPLSDGTGVGFMQPEHYGLAYASFKFQTHSGNGKIKYAEYDLKGRLVAQELRMPCRTGKMVVSNGVINFSGCSEWVGQNKSIFITTYESRQVKTLSSDNGIRSVKFNGVKYNKINHIEFNEQGEIIKVK